MKPRQLPFLALVAVLAAVAQAQDPKDTPGEPPQAPAGWKYVTAKDKSYRFLVPTETRRSGTRDRTFRSGRLSGRSQVNYSTLKDGTTLTVAATNLSGPAVRGMKIGDVYNAMIDGAKEDGATVTEPKEVTVGKLKGREIFITPKSGDPQRQVLIVVRGRVYELTVESKDKEKLTGETADTFLKSLVVIPRAAPAKDAGKDKGKSDTPKSDSPKNDPPPVR